MNEADLVLRFTGLVISAMAVWLAYLKQRQVLLGVVRQNFTAAANSHLETVQSRMRLLETTVESHDSSLEACERQRDAAYEALAAWHNLVGDIWLDATKTANPGY